MSCDSQPTITLRTGSRLHFGLWAWGDTHARQFGGVGMMIDQPEVVVQFSSAASFEVEGPAAGRLRQVVERCVQHWGLTTLPRCRIETVRLPRPHTGLGVGTQWSLAVAKGLAHWLGKGDLPLAPLAGAAGRGLRSAVGTHGFARGGLIVDTGKSPDDSLGELELHVPFPEAWRVVLVTPRTAEGMAGEPERQAFAQMPPIPGATTRQLQNLAREELAPAARAADFNRFSEAIFDYGHQAGLCFASLQGGAYSSEAICRLIATLRDMGVVGVGQSSWGPTVFSMVPDAIAAEELVTRLSSKIDTERHDIVITAPKNDGASIGRNSEMA